MNWIKANKFLVGLLAFTLVGAGVLGYFLMGAKDKVDEASANFDSTASELKRLESLPTYPNDRNLKKLQEQRQEHLTRIDDLQERLASMELPVDPMTPEQFQDRLKAAVTDFQKKATDANLTLPAKFYMGFDRYQGTPPRTEAAPLLGRELKAIALVLGYLVEFKVAELKDIRRDELPEEVGGAGSSRSEGRSAARRTIPTGGAGGDRAGRGGAAGGESGVVKKHSLEFVVYGDQAALQNVLNALVTSRSQFFIVRNLLVQNEKQSGPQHETVTPSLESAPPPGTAPAGTSAPAPASTTPAAAPTSDDKGIKFIVGEEKVDTTLLLDLVNFAHAPADQPVKAKGPTKPTPKK